MSLFNLNFEVTGIAFNRPVISLSPLTVGTESVAFTGVLHLPTGNVPGALVYDENDPAFRNIVSFLQAQSAPFTKEPLVGFTRQAERPVEQHKEVNSWRAPVVAPEQPTETMVNWEQDGAVPDHVRIALRAINATNPLTQSELADAVDILQGMHPEQTPLTDDAPADEVSVDVPSFGDDIPWSQ